MNNVRNLRRAGIRPFALIALAALTAAQSRVWVVGPSASGTAEFSEIQAAVDAAADGDTVLVQSGIYAGFSIVNKGVSVVADSNLVIVSGGVDVHFLAPAQFVVLRGLSIRNPKTDPVRIYKNAGWVWIDSCTLAMSPSVNLDVGYSLDGTNGVEAWDCALLTFSQCWIEGGRGASIAEGFDSGNGGHGLFARNATVNAFESQFFGGQGSDAYWSDGADGGDGGYGVIVSDGDLFASGCTLRGGDGGWGGGAQSEFDLCGVGGDGGHALETQVGSPAARLLTSVLIPGEGGPGGSTDDAACSAGGDGVATAVLSGSAEYLLEYRRALWTPSPVREESTVELWHWGWPGDLVGLLVSAGQTSTLVPELHGVLIGPYLPPILLGVSPDVGPTIFEIPIGPLPDASDDVATIFLQTVVLDAQGDAVLGGAQPLQILDSAF